MPIILVGSGRCGSTVLHRLLAGHPRVAWFSGFLDRHPDGRVNRWLMRAIDYPGIGPYLRRRFKPWECYGFWERHCRGFSRPCRDLRADDVTPRTRSEVREAMARLLTPKRDRLVIKITGWPRIGFLKEIFPDAKFVHLVRDGRAVANSMLAVDFWDGWRGPTSWRWGPLSPQEQEIWIQTDRSFVALAAIEWNRLMNAVESSRSAIPAKDFQEVRYEDLCADPAAVMKKVTGFCELPFTETFGSEVQRYPLENQNGKWRQELTPKQQAVLEQITLPQLRRYGYAG